MSFIIRYRFCIVCVLAVVFATGNIGQYLYFTGRIRADAAGYTERERELENRYGELEGELEGELGRKRAAFEIIGGIEAAVGRAGAGIQTAVSLVRYIRAELKELEACLAD
jgi:hypothetical protein